MGILSWIILVLIVAFVAVGIFAVVKLAALVSNNPDDSEH